MWAVSCHRQYSMFKECLNLASVDAVLNLMNVKVDPKPVEEPTPAEQPAEAPKGEAVDAEKKED